MTPHWLRLLSWTSIFLGAGSALVVVADIHTGHPQKMKVMAWVWPLTCLYGGLFAFWAYFKVGRSDRQEQAEGQKKAA